MTPCSPIAYQEMPGVVTSLISMVGFDFVIVVDLSVGQINDPSLSSTSTIVAIETRPLKHAFCLVIYLSTYLYFLSLSLGVGVKNVKGIKRVE